MAKKLLFLFFITTYFLLAQIDFQNALLYKADINSNQAYEMQQKDALLIDVRTKIEFKELRAKDSINIPIFYAQNGKRVFNKNFINKVFEASNNNINKKIILICRSGSRTKLASNLLASQGFKNIYNVKYGFQYDWLEVNLPIEK